MSRIDEAARNRLYNELNDKLDEGATLMQLVPTAQWDDLVTKSQVDARFSQVDARFAQVDARFARLEGKIDARFAEVDARFAEMGQRFAQTDAKIERTARTMTIWLVSTTFAFNGLLAAWLTAVH